MSKSALCSFMRGRMIILLIEYIVLLVVLSHNVICCFLKDLFLLDVILVYQNSIHVLVLLFDICNLVNCAHTFRDHDLHVETVVFLISLHICILVWLVSDSWLLTLFGWGLFQLHGKHFWFRRRSLALGVGGLRLSLQHWGGLRLIFNWNSLELIVLIKTILYVFWDNYLFFSW